jgi:hypothetical protein
MDTSSKSLGLTTTNKSITCSSSSSPMIGENRQLVTDEPVEIEK